MQANETAYGSFAKNSAFGPFLRVVMSAGVLALAGAHDRELGVTKERINSSGIGSSDVGPVTLRTAEGTVYMIASGAVAQFAKVYGAASGKVSGTANGNFIGYALTAAAADGDAIEVLRASDGGGAVFNAVAASGAVANTTTETAFDQSYTIPANTLKAGDLIKVRAQVIATATNSTDTLTLKLYLGSTVVVATAAVDVANNDIGYIDAVLVVRTAGGSGTVVAAGTQGLGTPGTVTAKPFNLASAALDTTAAQAVAVKATWSNANAGNSCRLDLLAVERIPA